MAVTESTVQWLLHRRMDAQQQMRWSPQAQTRLRPILMTSLAFILGVAPLVVATGAGSEMRQSLGTAVFAGMLGVTAFGLIFTPAFYTMLQRVGVRSRSRVDLGGREAAASGGSAKA